MYKQVQDMDQHIITAYERFSEPVSKRLLEIRRLLLDIAHHDHEIGPITETLKWGEPSYLTEQSKSGTTIRLSHVKERSDVCGVYVHCQTRLIGEFRDSFGDELEFSGNRAVLIDVNTPLDETLITMFLRKALTYHLKR